jgi:hypothetical protein
LGSGFDGLAERDHQLQRQGVGGRTVKAYFANLAVVECQEHGGTQGFGRDYRLQVDVERHGISRREQRCRNDSSAQDIEMDLESNNKNAPIFTGAFA